MSPPHRAVLPVVGLMSGAMLLTERRSVRTLTPADVTVAGPRPAAEKPVEMSAVLDAAPLQLRDHLVDHGGEGREQERHQLVPVPTVRPAPGSDPW